MDDICTCCKSKVAVCRARRDRSGADSVTSFWCRVWFGNIAWNWKVVFTTFFWLVRTLLQQNQTLLQKLCDRIGAASVATCAYCACVWIPETTAVNIRVTHGAWWVSMTNLKNSTEVETEMEIWSRNKLVINQWPHYSNQAHEGTPRGNGKQL